MSISVLSGEARLLSDDEKELYPPYRYVIESDFEYNDETHSLLVPRGFLTDGATRAPDYGSAWVFHDYLYATHVFSDGEECTREEADRIMENILRHDRMHKCAWLLGVLTRWNPFWIFSRAWRRSGERGPEFIYDDLHSSENVESEEEPSPSS